MSRRKADKLFSSIFVSRLSDFLEESGLSQASLARALKNECNFEIEPQSISDWLKGSIPRSDALLYLCKVANKPMEWFLGQNPASCFPDSDFTPIPKVTGTLSGGPGSWTLSPEVERYYNFRTEWLKSKGQPNYMKLMEVKGDSMEPTLKSGDYVLVDESQTEPRDGRIMAVMIKDEALVKRVGLEPDGKILLISDAEKTHRGPYPEEEVTILGRVVWLGREL